MIYRNFLSGSRRNSNTSYSMPKGKLFFEGSYSGKYKSGPLLWEKTIKSSNVKIDKYCTKRDAFPEGSFQNMICTPNITFREFQPEIYPSRTISSKALLHSNCKPTRKNIVGINTKKFINLKIMKHRKLACLNTMNICRMM